ncbi:MAG: ATP-binding protein [Phycisphaerae bacterium]
MTTTQTSPHRRAGLDKLSRKLAGPAVLACSGAAATLAVGSLLDLEPSIQQLLALIVLGAMGLLALLLRSLPAQLLAARQVLGALEEIQPDRICPEELTLANTTSRQGRNWNLLLEQYEALRSGRILEQADQQMTSRTGRGELAGVCDAISEGLMLISEKLRIKYANGAAAVYLNAERQALEGGKLADFIDQPELIEAIEAVAAGKGSPRMGIEVPRRDCEGVLRFGVRPVRREDSAAAMVIIEDITQEKVASESRNSFLAQATHELRAPLTNIRLYIETAIDEGEDDAALRGKCLNVINEEAMRLERVVSDILSVSEIEAGSFALRHDDVPVEKMLKELREHYQAQADEKQLELAFDLPDRLPTGQGDYDKINIALGNLMSNAMKYTPSGGKITVRADFCPDGFLIEVSDTGIGMGEEDAEKIFEKFYRARDQRISQITGTGLGLAMAREVVRLHGGDITVTSRLNEGSTFRMLLPWEAETI